MIVQSIIAMRARLEGRTQENYKMVGNIKPIPDANGRPCPIVMQQADPRQVDPKEIDLTDTQISIGCTAVARRPQNMKYTAQVGSRVNHANAGFARMMDHPEACNVLLNVDVRGEGTLAEASVHLASTAVRRRLRHMSHFDVNVDLYNDGRIYPISTQILRTSENVIRPDGVVRRAFHVAMTYTINSWVLFNEDTRDVKTAEEIELQWLDAQIGTLWQSVTVTQQN